MLQNNKINLIISILAAIAIWVYVVVEITPDENRTIRNVPVTLTNIDSLEERGLALTGDDDFSVDVVIRGSRSDISQISTDDIEATANVFGYPEGEHDLRVVVTVPDKVNLVDIRPSMITITIDKYVTASKPIQIKYEGEFANNTEPGFITMVPEEMEVTGAESVIDTVSSVVAMINSDDVKDVETTVDARAIPINDAGEPIDGVNLSQENVSVTLTLTHLKTVGLRVPIEGEAAEGFEVATTKFPNEITIRGVKAQLDNISYIEADAIDISNFSETTEIYLSFNLPNRIKIIDDLDNFSIIIEIQEIAGETPATDQATIDNEEN